MAKINGPIGISLKLLSTKEKLTRSLTNILRQITREAIGQATKSINEALVRILKQALYEDNAIQSILSGELRSHFGIANSNRTVDQIVEQLLSEIKVSHSPLSRGVGGFSAEIRVLAVWESFAGLLGLDVSTTKSHGGDVPWMKHLLLDGDKVLIKGYHILIKEGLPRSRSGNALMIEVDNKSQRGFWRVPIEYSGVKELNFLTKLLDAIIPTIDQMVEDKIVEAFSELN